jgi:hypothetical protein
MNSFGNKRDHNAINEHDAYPTPPVAVQALLDCEGLPKKLWEPACGEGNIVKHLRTSGYEVIASDIVDYGCPDSFVADFLDGSTMPNKAYDAIVTNPPFKLADSFVRRALTLCDKVYILQRLLFLEGVGRSDILDNHLRKVLLFKRRLPMMHRLGYTGKKSTSQVPYAWFVFDRRIKNIPATITRIDYKTEKKNGTVR